MARPRQISDEEVLASARACFLELGPGVSTTVIAERVGLSQAAIFKRFSTKRELMVAALLPPERPPFLDLIATGPDPARPLDDQLEEILLAIARFMQVVIPCMATLHASGLHKRELFARFEVPPPVRVQQALAAWFGRARDAGLVREIVPTDVATALMGSVHVRAFLQHVGAPGVGGPPEPYVHGVVQAFLHGIGAPR